MLSSGQVVGRSDWSRGVVGGVGRGTTKFVVDFVDFTGKCVVCCVVTTRKELWVQQVQQGKVQ
jgi:hypothetical protein